MSSTLLDILQRSKVPCTVDPRMDDIVVEVLLPTGERLSVVGSSYSDKARVLVIATE